MQIPRFFLWSFFVISIFFLSGCISHPPQLLTDQWILSNVRNIYPAESKDIKLSPDQDLIAVYFRQSFTDIQIRLDLLDHKTLPGYDLYLAIDTQPGGQVSLPISATANIEWDMLAVIPAFGPFKIISAEGKNISNSGLILIRDSILDKIEVRLKNEILAPWDFDIPYQTSTGWPRIPVDLQVFITPAGSKMVADQTEPVKADGKSPPTVKIFMAFWNTFPAYSPATSLRRWDGAHTGPSGGRHGLFNLLRTARSFSIPLGLLDLKLPVSLSALDYVDSLELVKAMEQERLLILPFPLPDPAYSPLSLSKPAEALLLKETEETSKDFGLLSSQMHIVPSKIFPPVELPKFIFLGAPEDTIRFDHDVIAQSGMSKIVNWRGSRLLLIRGFYPDSEKNKNLQQATPEGLALDWRRSLVSAFLISDIHLMKPMINILGGDLPGSTWGDPISARSTFHWLKDHPWIEFLDAPALLSSQPSNAHLSEDQLESSFGETHIQFDEELDYEILTELKNAPKNPLSIAAWQAYQALFAPVFPYSTELFSLRSNYISQIFSLLSGAYWAESAETQTTIDCAIDPDKDGNPECVLANYKYYAQFEINSGSLTFLFTLQQAEDGTRTVHQLIGPSSQFIIGLSDPKSWVLDNELESDPASLPGAFYEFGKEYTSEINDGLLSFKSKDDQVTKIFHLSQDGLQVEYIFSGNLDVENIKIPIVLDPWNRFTAGWAEGYHTISTAEGWILQNQLADHSQAVVKVDSSIPGRLISFVDSIDSFAAPENPNQDYPPGHFLPFPVQIIQLNIAPEYHSFSIEIKALPAAALIPR